MDSPLRPPDYSLPSYADDHDTPTGQNAAAVRLLTSVDEPINDHSPSYVSQTTSSFQSTVPLPAQPNIASSSTLPSGHVNDSSPPEYFDSLQQQQGAQTINNNNNNHSFVSNPLGAVPRRKSLLKRLGSVKLQTRRKPARVAFSQIVEALPELPEGPSERRKLRQSSSGPSTPLENPSGHNNQRPPFPTVDEPGDNDSDDEMKQKSNLHGPYDSERPRPQGRRNYQPSVISSFEGSYLSGSNISGSNISGSNISGSNISGSNFSSSILDDAPSMPHPDSTYIPFAGRENGSPTRPWTPSSRSSEYTRPPPTNLSYEPSDLNGSPRPGTPSSRYGGSPRRPLPPAPLFSNGARASGFAPDATINIPLSDHDDPRDDDDVFGPDSDLSQARPLPTDRDSYVSSQMTLNEDEQDEYFDEKDSEFHHYGEAPDGAQERRGVRAPEMSRKEVQLINGELVLECKIPTILYSFLPRRDEVEFTHMRYTAVTCDPDDFADKGYKLRQCIGRTTRETELFICITMYNEDEIGFTRTMHAVMKNISHFCSRNKSRTWGETGWQKIVVCIISDGREKIHPRTLDALAAMGVYQDGIAKNYVNNRAVQAHVYEYTTQVSLDSDLKFKGAEKGIVPCQMIFCLKERNSRKLNSHRWFFNAFGKALNPNVCILLDVGTRPTSNSLYHLWKAFDTDSNVAGACGEIKAMKGRMGANLLNPLVASQNFEYKLSNILDKPLESVFGYITVLPGALSAYRYHALQNDETGHGPLSQYFKGETLHGQHADVFTANMYLAEDRILCWELVAKRDERWVLKYVKNCKGETDVPDTVPEFISQRRRWLNGAFFAAVYSLVQCRQILATDHTIVRKGLLFIEMGYQFIQLLFTYFSLANFYLTFYFVAGGLSDKRVDPFGHGLGAIFFIILKFTCVLLICTQFVLSLGNRPQGSKKLYLTSLILYCVIMVYTSFAVIYIVIRQLTADHDSSESAFKIGNNVFTNLIVSVASTIGLYIVMSLLYLEPWHLITSSAQYFLLLPFYLCTLQVYAFCNTHDVTWGTKGDNVVRTDLGGAIGKGETVELEMPSEQLDIDSGYDEALRNLRDRVEVSEPPMSEAQMQQDYYKSVRTYMVLIWLISNGLLAMGVSEAYGSTGIGENFYLRFILWSVAGLALFRAIGSTTFAIINVVNIIVEGRVRMSLSVPKWMGGWFGGVSDKVSESMSGVSGGVSGIGSSIGSSLTSITSKFKR